jgi:hypothetical protein
VYGKEKGMLILAVLPVKLEMAEMNQPLIKRKKTGSVAAVALG